MATGRQQTMMEVWPIERHLTEFQKERNAQCVFVAPSIFSDSLRQIQFVSFQSNGKKEIRPYAINDFVEYLEQSPKLYQNYYKTKQQSNYSMVAEASPTKYGKK